MENRALVIDQTVNEALRLGIGTNNINSIIRKLQKYHMEVVDVDLKYWKNNSTTFENNIELDLLRCIVSTSLEEITLAKEIGFSKVEITWMHNSKDLSLFKLYSALTVARNFAKEVYLCIENASEISTSEIESYWSIIIEYGVKRFIYKDKNSNMDVFRTFEELVELKNTAPCAIEFIGNNAYGLATANCLAAFRAGIKYIGTAVGGVGIPGNAAMEEVLMALKHLWKQGEVPDGFSLAKDCSEILGYIGIKLPVDKAVIGRDVFAHESGIHVDGIFKNPSLYEVIKPEEVGLTRRLIIGKHSGTASIKFKFLQWNLKLNKLETRQMLEEVKEIAISQKSPLSDCQLQQLYKKQHMVNGY